MPLGASPVPATMRQRAGQLAVPGLEGMRALAAVAEAVAVIAAGNDVQQPARAAGVGVVVHGEQPAEGVEAVMERVPEAGGDADQLRCRRAGSEKCCRPRRRRERGAVAADQLVRCAEVLAHAEVQIAQAVEGEPAQAVVRIVALRLELDERPLLVGRARPCRAAGRFRSAWPGRQRRPCRGRCSWRS